MKTRTFSLKEAVSFVRRRHPTAFVRYESYQTGFLAKTKRPVSDRCPHCRQIWTRDEESLTLGRGFSEAETWLNAAVELDEHEARELKRYLRPCKRTRLRWERRLGRPSRVVRVSR